MGAGVLIVAALVANRLERMETQPHETTFGQEAKRVISSIVAGLKEVASRPPAALGLSSFQMLRYQFWGFCLFTFGLYAKNLVQSGADNLGLALVGGGGFLGGALGLVLAQKWKDRVPPIRLLMGAMFALGAATIVFGSQVSLPGFAALLFVGFFTFFLGKISADTIMQQSMPDDFRGRAFALFDIAYNLGFIIPALILSFVWIEDDPTRTRAILVVSGADLPAADARDLPVVASDPRPVRSPGRSRRGPGRRGVDDRPFQSPTDLLGLELGEVRRDLAHVELTAGSTPFGSRASRNTKHAWMNVSGLRITRRRGVRDRQLVNVTSCSVALPSSSSVTRTSNLDTDGAPRPRSADLDLGHPVAPHGRAVSLRRATS